jgi:hypothetical protein
MNEFENMTHEELDALLSEGEVEITPMSRRAKIAAQNGELLEVPTSEPEHSTEAPSANMTEEPECVEPEIVIPDSPYIGVYNEDDWKDETPWVETFPHELEAAARYFTQRKIAVFPTIGKVPDTSHGCKDATLSQNAAVNMFRRRKDKPGLGIGVDCERANYLFSMSMSKSQASIPMVLLEWRR